MNRTALHRIRHSLVAVAAMAVLAGCGEDSPVGPRVDTDKPAVDLGNCDSLRVPAGSMLAFHAYAQGDQVYRWDGTSWNFVAPSAKLFADAQGTDVVGRHYGGPTWESASGGTVIGAVRARCTPNPDAIPWLLLGAVSEGPGVFQGVTHIQRMNTVGGKAPTENGSFTNQVRNVPYTAEYFFYRAP
jgi:hypothetical protein